jgi:hypothetical protein
MNTYFKDKQMLLIFDEFDLICHEKEVRYPTYLFQALHNCNINCIFVTRRKISAKIREFGQKFSFYKLPGLPIHKSLILLLAN